LGKDCNVTNDFQAAVWQNMSHNGVVMLHYMHIVMEQLFVSCRVRDA